MIWQAYQAHIKEIGDRPALIWNGGQMTHAELTLAVQERAEALPKVKTKGPARVLIQPTEPTELLLNLLACWSRGLVPALLRSNHDPEQTREIEGMLQPIASAEGKTISWLVSSSRSSSARLFGARDEALLICTSGTLGPAKWVALPAEAITINAAEIAKQLALKTEDVVAVPTPLSYMYGLMGGAISALFRGACIRLFDDLTPPSEVQAAIRSNAITVLQGPPSWFRLFMEYWNGVPFTGIRLITTGGEQASLSLIHKISSVFPRSELQFLYGMTEAGPRISHKKIDHHTFIEGRVGRPFSYIDWRIAPQESMDKQGRLVMRGPNIFLGYVQQNGQYTGLDDNDYFYSPDLVRAEPSGELHFLGRVDRLFKSGGKLVNPAAIEGLLVSHDDIVEARCRQELHEMLGFVPIVEIVPNKSASVDISELRALCQKKLPRHEVPRRFEIRERFAIAPSGKRSASQDR